MKLIGLFFLLLVGFQKVSEAQHSFPKERYSYAKLYLMNTKKSTSRPDLSAWKNDRYAFSKMGEGIALNEEHIAALNKITAQDMSTLQGGLSKCFLPRHGIIFFDDANRPVASISICFECQKIDLYPARVVNSNNKFDSKKAMKQLKAFEKFVTDLGLPIFDEARLYEKLHEKEAYQQQGEVEMSVKNMLSQMLEKPTFKSEITTKIKISRTARIVEKKREKPGGDGKMVSFLEQTFYASKLNYLMGEEEWELHDAVIQDPGFLFDNGIAIGMSQEHLMAHLGVYDGPSYPKVIKVTDPARNAKIVFTFGERTLRRIEITL